MWLNKKISGLVDRESSKHIPVGLIVSVIIFFELIIVINWKYKPDLVSNIQCLYLRFKEISNTHCNWLGFIY